MYRINHALLAITVAAGLWLGTGAMAPEPPRDAEPGLFEWATSLSSDDQHRLAAVLAVKVAAAALDLTVTTLAGERPASRPPAAAAPRQPVRATRPLMPFYSFASTANRTRES